MTEHDVEIIDNLMIAAEHAVQALDGLTERQGPELAEVTFTEWKTKGLRPLYLKRLTSTTAHLRKDEAA